ncbi:MAG: hypothetical protein JXB32_24075 [Deltaproteobacteria bacterium]|nr:hypothetical protein [Deltaproteobacteria bacterium]
MDVAAFWAAYKVQIIVWVVVVLLAFFVLSRMFGVVHLVVFLAIGAALGWGSAWALQHVGVPGAVAYFAAALVTVVVLLLGMRHRKR